MGVNLPGWQAKEEPQDDIVVRVLARASEEEAARHSVAMLLAEAAGHIEQLRGELSEMNERMEQADEIICRFVSVYTNR